MIKLKFKKNFHGVLAPSYRGASYPAFDKAGINESKFEDKCRYKEYDIDFDESSNAISIDWMTQDDCTCHSQFLNEVKRCFKHIGFTGTINVKIYDRDGYDEFLETIDCSKG